MKDWAEYVDQLKPAVELAGKVRGLEGAALKAALFRQFAMNLAQGYFLYFQATPEHPEFAPFQNSVFLAQPNPDAVYYYTPVSGAGVYRITGERGDAPVAGLAVGNKMIGMREVPGRGFGNFDIDELEIGADGRFEVIFSADRPAAHAGNWLPLHPEADFILVRQFSYDWGAEVDMRLAIERLDVAPLKPAMTPEETDAKLSALFGGYVRNLTNVCLTAIEAPRAAGCVNKFRLNTFQDLGNTRDWPQAYYEGVFELGPGEALILETELPAERKYWNVQVIDPLWNQVELVYRQTSLNGGTARIDSDGRFRAVLAHEDPGVHNWLDTGGNEVGELIGRWYRCSDHPIPTLTKVRLADLRDHLPGDTPAITPAEREAALHQRRIGAQLRRRW